MPNMIKKRLFLHIAIYICSTTNHLDNIIHRPQNPSQPSRKRKTKKLIPTHPPPIKPHLTTAQPSPKSKSIHPFHNFSPLRPLFHPLFTASIISNSSSVGFCGSTANRINPSCIHVAICTPSSLKIRQLCTARPPWIRLPKTSIQNHRPPPSSLLLLAL